MTALAAGGARLLHSRGGRFTVLRLIPGSRRLCLCSFDCSHSRMGALTPMKSCPVAPRFLFILREITFLNALLQTPWAESAGKGKRHNLGKKDEIRLV